MSTQPSNYYVAIAGNSSNMMQAVNTKPMSVTIQADTFMFQTYSSGVITSTRCGTRNDHAVQVTGYVTSSYPSYWIVRNSWGTSWGLAGYVNIAMGTGYGICGINELPQQPFTDSWPQ